MVPASACRGGGGIDLKEGVCACLMSAFVSASSQSNGIPSTPPLRQTLRQLHQRKTRTCPPPVTGALRQRVRRPHGLPHEIKGTAPSFPRKSPRRVVQHASPARVPVRACGRHTQSMRRCSRPRARVRQPAPHAVSGNARCPCQLQCVRDVMCRRAVPTHAARHALALQGAAPSPSRPQLQ